MNSKQKIEMMEEFLFQVNDWIETLDPNVAVEEIRTNLKDLVDEIGLEFKEDYEGARLND